MLKAFLIGGLEFFVVGGISLFIGFIRGMSYSRANHKSECSAGKCLHCGSRTKMERP